MRPRQCFSSSQSVVIQEECCIHRIITCSVALRHPRARTLLSVSRNQSASSTRRTLTCAAAWLKVTARISSSMRCHKRGSECARRARPTPMTTAMRWTLKLTKSRDLCRLPPSCRKTNQRLSSLSAYLSSQTPGVTHRQKLSATLM